MKNNVELLVAGNCYLVLFGITLGEFKSVFLEMHGAFLCLVTKSILKTCFLTKLTLGRIGLIFAHVTITLWECLMGGKMSVEKKNIYIYIYI